MKNLFIDANIWLSLKKLFFCCSGILQRRTDPSEYDSSGSRVKLGAGVFAQSGFFKFTKQGREPVPIGGGGEWHF